MPITATPLGVTNRYIPAGTRKYLLVPTIANKNAPTLVELNAGTDLTAEIESVDGFQTKGSTVDVPDAGSKYVGKIDGRVTSDNATITIYLDNVAGGATGDARTLFVRGDQKFVAIFPEGDETVTPPKKVDIYPVRVLSVTKSQDIEKAATLMVEFAITSAPAENIDIPTT